MRAFLVGLIFLFAVAILAGIGLMLLPLILLLAFLLRVLAAFFFVIMAVWLLGKFIIYIWEKIIK